MSIEVHKAIVRRFFREALAGGRMETLHEILDPHCSYVDGGELRFTSRDDFVGYVIEAREPFTRTDVVIDDLIAEGDRVAVRCVYHLMADGARSALSVMGFFQFREGRIVGIWRNVVTVAGGR